MKDRDDFLLDVFVPDDLLDTHCDPAAAAGGAFTILLHLVCHPNVVFGGIPGRVRDPDLLRDSGEQTADVYVEDGSQHIPVRDPVTKVDFWSIACDKDTRELVLPSGGSVELPWATSVATLSVPQGALAAPTWVNMANALPIPSLTAVPAGFLPITEALYIGPPAVCFAIPATVTLPYTDGEIEGYDEEALQVLQFDRGSSTWQVIPSSLDPTGNTLFFQVSCAARVFGIAGPPAP